MSKKEKIIKDLVSALEEGADYPFLFDNIDNLLDHGETLKALADDLVESDKNNPLVTKLKGALNNALSDLYAAKERRDEIDELQDEIDNDVDMDPEELDEKNIDMHHAENYGASCVEDAEAGYQESLKQALVIESNYEKENTPTI